MFTVQWFPLQLRGLIARGQIDETSSSKLLFPTGNIYQQKGKVSLVCSTVKYGGPGGRRWWFYTVELFFGKNLLC